MDLHNGDVDNLYIPRPLAYIPAASTVEEDPFESSDSSSDEEEDVNELESSDEEDVGVASAKQRVRTRREQVKELRALPLALQAVQASALASRAEYPLRQQSPVAPQ